MAYTFDKANAKAPSKRDTQYFEMFCNRGIYHDGWYACTTPFAPPWLMGTGKLPDVNDYKWELYNITEDFSQNNDLAAKNPDKLKEMQALFLTEAAKYQVLPLDNTLLTRLVTPRPSAVAGQSVFTYKGENAGIPVGNAPEHFGQGLHDHRRDYRSRRRRGGNDRDARRPSPAGWVGP